MKKTIVRSGLFTTLFLALPGCLAINAVLGVMSFLGTGPIQVAGTVYSVGEYSYEYAVNDKTPDEVIEDKLAWLMEEDATGELPEMTGYARATRGASMGSPAVTAPILAAWARPATPAPYRKDGSPDATHEPARPATDATVLAAAPERTEPVSRTAPPADDITAPELAAAPVPDSGSIQTANRADVPAAATRLVPVTLPVITVADGSAGPTEAGAPTPMADAPLSERHDTVMPDADPLQSRLDRLKQTLPQAEKLALLDDQDGVLISVSTDRENPSRSGVNGTWHIRHRVMESPPMSPLSDASGSGTNLPDRS